MYEPCITCPKLGKPCNGPNFSALTTAERLEWIKKRKNHLGWTNGKLAEESNTPKGTIDSLLSGTRTGANTETLRPIFEALIGGYDNGKPCPNPPTEADISLEKELALKNKDIEEKDAAIAELKGEIARLKDHIKHSDDLHVKDKANAVDEYRKAFAFQRVLASVLAVLLILALGVILVAVFIDKANPGMGFFWLEEATATIFGSKTGNSLSGIADWMQL